MNCLVREWCWIIGFHYWLLRWEVCAFTAECLHCRLSLADNHVDMVNDENYWHFEGTYAPSSGSTEKTLNRKCVVCVKIAPNGSMLQNWFWFEMLLPPHPTFNPYEHTFLKGLVSKRLLLFCIKKAKWAVESSQIIQSNFANAAIIRLWIWQHRSGGSWWTHKCRYCLVLSIDGIVLAVHYFLSSGSSLKFLLLRGTIYFWHNALPYLA